MNYYQARQREGDKRWDYTCMNDGRIWPIGYCVEYKEFSKDNLAFSHYTDEQLEKLNADQGQFREKYHVNGHETAEEAEDCYKEYLLDHRLKFYKDESEEERHEKKCQICGILTTGRAEVDHSRHFDLCPEHQSREKVWELFEVGQSISSY